MAKALKSKASNTLIWILMGLLVVGLAGFGSVSFTGGSQSVASVGDREVEVNEYARGLDRALANLERQTGQRLTLAQAQLFGVSQQVLGELMLAAALDNETDKIGFSAGDERLALAVRGLPGFQGVDGQFDPESYRSTITRAGLEIKDFEADLRDEIVRVVLESAVAYGVDAPRTAQRAFVKYLSTERDVSFVILGEADLDAPVDAPDEGQLRTFHTDNADAFFVPETRALTYAWLTPEMLAPAVTVDEGALRSAYDARSDEFNRPERRLVERLVFATQAEADASQARLDAGEVDFPGLVAERGLELGDIDLGDATKAGLGGAGDAVFALEETGLTGVVESDLGPAIFRVNAILYAQVTTFDDAREQLEQDYALEEARRQIADISVDVDDLLAGGATLEELAGETELELGQIDYTAAAEQGIAADAGFRNAAATVTADDFPQVETLENGGIFAVRLDALRDQRPMTFDEARRDVENAWRTEATAAALSVQAESLAGKIAGGGDLAELSDSVVVRTGLTRQDGLPELPAAALAAIFEMDAGETRILSENGEAALIVVDGVRAPDITDEATAAQSLAVAQQLSQSIAQDMFQLYTNALQTEAGITLNQQMIGSVHAQFP